MRKIMYGSLASVLLGLLLVSAFLMDKPVSWAAENKEIELLDAFTKCFVSYEIFAKDGGKSLDLKIKKITSTPLIVKMKSGNINLASIFGQPITATLKKDKKVDLTTKDESTVTNLPQTMKVLITGSIKMNPSCK